MTHRFLSTLRRTSLAGVGVGAALLAASPAWSQVKVDAPAADVEVDAPRAKVDVDADAPRAKVDVDADAPASPAREAREAGREVREEARDARDSARDTGREAAREGREAAREGREAVREGRREAREARRDSREFRVDSVRSPDIGLWLRSSNEGLLVADIAAEGAIAKIGLREGDRIISVNGQKVTTEREFVRYLFADDVRTERVEVVILRDGNQETIIIEPTVFVEEYRTVQRDPLFDFGIIIDDRYDDRIVVQRVLPSSPAYYSGLRSGDAITTFRGQRIRALADLMRVAADIDAGPVDLEVNRGERSRQISIDLPEAGADVDVDADVRGVRRPGQRGADVDVNVDGRSGRTEGRVEGRAKARLDGDLPDADAPDRPARPRSETPSADKPDIDTPPTTDRPTPRAKTPATPRSETPSSTPRAETPAAPRAEAPATPSAPATPKAPSAPRNP